MEQPAWIVVDHIGCVIDVMSGKCVHAQTGRDDLSQLLMVLLALSFLVRSPWLTEINVDQLLASLRICLNEKRLTELSAIVGLDYSESLFEQVWSKEILDLVEYLDDIL